MTLRSPEALERRRLCDLARGRRQHPVRPTTIPVRKTSRRHLEIIRSETAADLRAAGDVFRPVTRADCASVSRPCPFVSCKHHLYLDVSPKNGTLKLNFPDLEPGELSPGRSCALDVADAGGATMRGVGALLNMTKERVRQIERVAAEKVQPGLRRFSEEGTDQ